MTTHSFTKTPCMYWEYQHLYMFNTFSKFQNISNKCVYVSFNVISVFWPVDLAKRHFSSVPKPAFEISELFGACGSCRRRFSSPLKHVFQNYGPFVPPKKGRATSPAPAGAQNLLRNSAAEAVRERGTWWSGGQPGDLIILKSKPYHARGKFREKENK
jgi:hypothetical protein